MVPASLGMSKYYEYVLKSIKGMKLVASSTNDIEDPTDEELDEIVLEERIQKELDSWHKEEDLEKLLEETSEFLKKNTRILH
jgi:uncharacterized protein YgfB (UPF0149 family)